MGLKQNEITFFTVPDTGVRLPVRKVSPSLIQEVERSLRREMPEPKPPKQEVDYGNGPEVEENPAHPAYVAAMEEWKSHFNVELSTRTQKLLIRRGVLPNLNLTDEQIEQVKVLKEEMKEYGVEMEGDDKWIFVTAIALGTVEDIGDLTNALIRRSTVTEEAVQEALRKF